MFLASGIIFFEAFIRQGIINGACLGVVAVALPGILMLHGNLLYRKYKVVRRNDRHSEGKSR